jgi:hypothetical protein
MELINHYCITGKNYSYLNDLDLKIIVSGSISKDLSKFPDSWLKDSTGNNISNKNKNFGTLSSHYWLWNNEFINLRDDDWIGINHYRRFWIDKPIDNLNSLNLKKHLLRFIPIGDFEVLLPEKINLVNLKLSKLIKKGFRSYIKNPKLLFNRKKISINLHFDLFHGYDLLNQSANLLEKDDCLNFKNYINNNCSFYPLQMFISKKKYIVKLYEKTFNWIFKCEKIFSKIELTGYGKERLYDFLAERYFSYYFQKNLKIQTWPYILLKENFNEI